MDGINHENINHEKWVVYGIAIPTLNSPVTRHWRLAVILLGRGMQQASELVTALTDFARGDEQIILADVSLAMRFCHESMVTMVGNR